MNRALLICNPTSGKMKAKANFFNIIERLDEADFRVATAFTRYCGHAIELAKEAAVSGEFDSIICCGGDGTLNEVINGILDAKSHIAVGYIPAGSTNDFASSMNLESGIMPSVEKIVNGSPLPLDAGLFNQRFFTYIATFGAFTSVSYSTPQSFKNVFGHMAYVLSGVKDITTIQPYNVTVKTGDKQFSDEYIFGAVCNSTSVAGIVKIDAEYVDMNDGLFEVILVKNPKNIVELNEIVWKCVSSDFSGKMFEFFKVSEISFDMPGNIPWSVDGEKVDGTEQVVIKNVHNALNFIR